MPTVITEGAASARGFGFGASGAGGANYIEDVFSTYLYTGTGASQTITNGIDLSTKGGLVWMKSRSAATDHALYDTARGATFDLVSNTTAAQTTQSTGLTAFGTTGFSIGALAKINTSAATYASWTFRKQAKFFDIVTYTGTGSNTTIAHNLGSTPGCIIVKRTDAGANWSIYHVGLTSASYFITFGGSAASPASTIWNDTAPTSSVFSIGTSLNVNTAGSTYVAYLFASNAGGFGAAGTDNVITCGSFTTDGSGNATVTLGYEPQWVMFKRTDVSQDWYIFDVMRGMPVSGPAVSLAPNNSSAEVSYSGSMPAPTATGFMIPNTFGASAPVIYIAIRRGPMKTPTDATKVFSPVIYTSIVSSLNTNIVADLSIQMQRDNIGVITEGWTQDRLRGVVSSYHNVLATTSTMQEESGGISGSITNFGLSQYSISMVATNAGNSVAGGNTYVDWFFSRAPGFFDEVCYTGTGTYPQTINHNLGVAPELIIGKQRNGTYQGQVWQKDLGFYAGSSTYGLYLFSSVGNSAKVSSAAFGGSPTATTFTATTTETASSGNTFVAYLFATCPGVSKVGSYTGTGATQTVDCGFTGGARFVLIKRTDSTGDWYVWDTARGMVSGTDPYLLLNTTAAEVNANSVYTATTGFQIVSTAAGINASGGSYIFLAIA